MLKIRPLAIASALLLLSACGKYTPDVAQVALQTVSNVSASSCDELFTKSVQPRLEFCRTCHVPGGVAGTNDDGKLFMLSSDHSQDFDNLRASWQALGGNNNG